MENIAIFIEKEIALLRSASSIAEAQANKLREALSDKENVQSLMEEANELDNQLLETLKRREINKREIIQIARQ